MACRLNKSQEDDELEDFWSTIATLLITSPLVILLFAFASRDQNITAAATAERSPSATAIVLPQR